MKHLGLDLDVDWNHISRMHTTKRGRKLPSVLWAVRVLLHYGWANMLMGVALASTMTLALLTNTAVAWMGFLSILTLFLALVVLPFRRIVREHG